VFVRRLKHEWSDELDGLDARELAVETDPIHGSKFSANWMLERYVDWLEAQVARLGWTRDTGSTEAEVTPPDPVGWSRGRSVSKIRIEFEQRIHSRVPGLNTDGQEQTSISCQE
jgi:hypothetical protein